MPKFLDSINATSGKFDSLQTQTLKFGDWGSVWGDQCTGRNVAYLFNLQFKAEYYSDFSHSGAAGYITFNLPSFVTTDMFWIDTLTYQMSAEEFLQAMPPAVSKPGFATVPNYLQTITNVDANEAAQELPVYVLWLFNSANVNLATAKTTEWALDGKLRNSGQGSFEQTSAAVSGKLLTFFNGEVKDFYLTNY